MNPHKSLRRIQTRRQFFGRSAFGIGAAALSSLLARELHGAQEATLKALPGIPHHPPKAKRVIYLFMSGGPSQLELFDDKPLVRERHGQELPDSIRKGQRLTGMTSTQTSFPLAGSRVSFERHGESGAIVSELLPHTAKIVDELTFIKSMKTEAINHDPAVTFFQTGSQIAGRPSMGAWATYGLGSESTDLPAFVVLITKGTGGQPIYDRLWGSGFLPTHYQGVKFRSVGDPILYLNDPPGFDRTKRRRYLDALAELNQIVFDEFGDPEISTRIAQYEMAYRMQASVPELTDISDEPLSTFELYGEDARTPGRSLRTVCWRDGLPSATSASFSSTTGAGINTATCRKAFASSAPRRTRLRRRSSAISSKEDFWTIRSSFGAASSAVLSIARAA